MIRRFTACSAILLVAALAAGCAATQAFRAGQSATRAGNLDEAVMAYRRAVQADPNNAAYKIALERAMLAASQGHQERAKMYQANNQLEAALSEYQLASEYDPSNRAILDTVANIQRTLRDRAEAARPRAPAQVAQAAPTTPNLNPASRTPLRINFNNALIKDVLNFISGQTGINVSYDRDVTDRPMTLQLTDVTLEQALNQIMTMNQLSYKVVSDRSIFVFPDTPQKHAQYDEQVIRTFYISNADATELAQTLSNLIRITGIGVQPVISVNRTTNTITIRASTAIADIISRVISQTDKPRAEILVDVEILEVDRSRAKSYGLNLSEYVVGGIFSPEVSPGQVAAQTGTGTGTGTTTTTGRSVSPGQVGVPGQSPPPFNLNTISRGVTTSDFYLAVPTAVVRFLESDTHTRIMAKPQLRGAEGTKMTYNVGTQVPVVSTSFTPLATGGTAINPLASYTYKPVGVNLDITPRVTLDGDIILDLTIDDSQRGPDTNVAGTTVPTFVQRTVTTRLRLRDGEPNLLAGLVQQNDSNSVQGFPGAVHLPFLKQVFSGNNITTDQTEIIMLLTPHIIRTQELTADDLKPLFIGSAQNLGIGGPPPLIAPPAQEAAPQSAAPQTLPAPGGATVAPPAGSSPVPGTVPVPATPAPRPPAVVQPTPAPEPPQAPAPVTPQAQAAQPQAASPPQPTAAITTPGVGSAQVVITPPSTTFRVGGGPYTVPLSIVDASRISTVTLTLLFDPTKLRVRNVQEGSFMRTGGADVTFNQQVNAATGRVDIIVSRGTDAIGASGTGLLAAVLFDAIAPGPATLTLSGTATGPGDTAMGLQFRPVTVNVQ